MNVKGQMISERFNGELANFKVIPAHTVSPKYCDVEGVSDSYYLHESCDHVGKATRRVSLRKSEFQKPPCLFRTQSNLMGKPKKELDQGMRQGML
jgi:hypothetical protein